MDVHPGVPNHDAKPPFPLPQAREYFRQLCLGLEYLHHNGVVHRDVSTSLYSGEAALTCRSSRTISSLLQTENQSSCVTLGFRRCSSQKAMIESKSRAGVRPSLVLRASAVSRHSPYPDSQYLTDSIHYRTSWQGCRYLGTRGRVVLHGDWQTALEREQSYRAVRRRANTATSHT